MKIAVTAANGKLGSAIVHELKKEVGAENVVGIVRSPEKAQYLGIEIKKGDYNSRTEFNEALKGIDHVLMVSGMDAPEKRIGQHRNIIEAAKTNGVKKIVYTSIIGAEEGNAFSPIVRSNRQTEENVKNSGLNWSLGRNGIYIEPDLEYIDTYIKEGGINNCAGEGKCGYTSRPELAYAYTKMLLDDKHNGNTYNLAGNAISQEELANLINHHYGTNLSFNPMSVEAYTEERRAALGDFLGTVIAGIYSGIKAGEYNIESHYGTVAGRPHKSPSDLILTFRKG